MIVWILSALLIFSIVIHIRAYYFIKECYWIAYISSRYETLDQLREAFEKYFPEKVL